MQSTAEEKVCPRCQSRKMTSWRELSDEQRFLAERLPASAEFTPDERKMSCFCTRCWFEVTGAEVKIA